MDPLEPPISALTRRPAGTPQKPPPAEPSPKTPSNSRFPFFSRQASVRETAPPAHPTDEFINLNIQAALFPEGYGESFSPAAFHNLVQNAERLLSRLQTAYKQRTESLQEMTIEKETQAEELKGCEMRARHLKLQLENMTAKFAEQDQVMMNLVDEFAQEKQLRYQEQEALKKSVKSMKASRSDLMSKDVAQSPQLHELRRGSDVSVISAISDSGFESDEESPTDIISKHQDAPSPSVSVSSRSTANSHGTNRLMNLPPPIISYSSVTAQRSQPKAPSSTSSPFSGARKNPGLASTLRNPFGPSCGNCQGIRASEAWNVVSVLKEENCGLKERLGHIENSVDGCLELVTSMIENRGITN
jgi:hypothetical protein